MVAGGKEMPWPSQVRPEKRAVQAKLAAMVSSLRPRYLLDLTMQRRHPGSRSLTCNVKAPSYVGDSIARCSISSKVVGSPDWARG
jgi:hypothetical protein